jgi:hypothetical protein
MYSLEAFPERLEKSVKLDFREAAKQFDVSP